MAVVNTTNTIREAGNGVKVAFDVPFVFYNTTDLKVYKILNSTGARTLMSLGSDYTVAISASAEGGTVTYSVAPTSLQDSFIEREQPYTQSTNIPAVGGVREEQLEKGLDKLCILILQLLKKTQLALKFISSSSQSDVILPEPEVGKVLGWGSVVAENMENYTADSGAAALEAAASATAASASQTAAASSASAASSSASAASASAATAAALRKHYREGLSIHWESSTDTIGIEAGHCEIGGTSVNKADRSTLSIATAGNYAGGVSLRATNTVIWVGIDASGNFRLHTTAATHSDSALSVTTGKKRYVSWSGTTYRVLGWIRTNGTGSGEIDSTRAGNIKDVNTRNRVYYRKTAATAGNTNLPIDTSDPQSGEGTEMLRAGIVIGDAQSKIKLLAALVVENTDGGNGAGVISALFKSGTASAKTAVGSTDSTGTGYSDQNHKIEYEEAASAVGWQEWFVNCGQGTANILLNTFQDTAVGKLGSVLVLEEVDP